MDDFNEFYNVLNPSSIDNKDLRDEFVQNVTKMFETIKMSDINIEDDSYNYDLENDFIKYQSDNISKRYELNSYAIDYKLKLMQDYVKELFAEKKFLDFRREKEKELDKETYLNYINDESVRSQLIGSWYKEFVEK
jgi:hypothetical protein